MTDQSRTTVFHITHWKAGSQWVAEILKNAAPGRIVLPSDTMDQIFLSPIVPGAIYPTIYVPYPKFQRVLAPEVDRNPQTYQPSSEDPLEVKNWYNFIVNRHPVKKFVVVRDLRDTLVSLYYSLKVSHPPINKHVIEGRETLANLDFEEGFLKILPTKGRKNSVIQTSWIEACAGGEALLVRYEDLIANEQAEFAKIIEYCQIDISSGRLADIVSNNSFSKHTGRKPGQEDVSSHFRKGISGDWKNHFTDRIKAEFKAKFGQHLIDTGYEQNLDW
jgi:lipopolysaccharide transport system ATP-binding protein